jgi:aminoglycoside phosphotransferase family enzyme
MRCLIPPPFRNLPDRVELRETHISWVFLAGDRAYKVRKPVRFPFLDCGTVARRRELCAEELRLGRRFAPRVHAGLV